MTSPATLATGAALSLRGLVWRPATRREPTLDGIDLEITAGQRVLLAGASGCGKSTLLRALAGLLDPESGDLSGEQCPADRPGERGMLLQNPVHALVGATIGRDAAFGPENAALDRHLIHAAAASALEDARVPLDADVSPWDASGGEQQRIALAGALALSPDALLLDEPTSMLDAPTAAAVRDAILAVADGRTLVIADHDLSGWLGRVDRLIVLGPQARVLADGDPEQLLHDRRALLEQAGLRLPPERDGVTRSAAPGERASAADKTSGIVLRARELTVARRGDPAGPPLLHGLDLRLHEGTLTVLSGPSGSGKTSLLRVLLGLDAPAAGTLDRPESSRIAWVPQNPEHAFVAATVREEVVASPWARDQQLAEHLLAAAGLDHLAGANPYTLSGGEQRRLAICAALAQRPQLLVLDEPTVGLDRLRAEQVLALLEDARGGGCAVIAASHDVDLRGRADQLMDLGERHTESAPSTVHSGTSPATAPTGPPGEARTGRSAPDRSIGPVPRSPRVPADALHPLTLSLIGLLGALGSFAVQSWEGGLLALAPVLLLAPLAVRSVPGAMLRMAPVLVSALALAWTTALLGEAPSLTGEAWLLGLKEACRITLFVAPGVLTFSSIDPTALGDALAQRLRLPARPVAASVSALVRAGHLREQWTLITQARTVRGLGGTRSPRMLAGATLALLVDGLRSAELQALAMDARGFATARRRTWALPSRFRRIDLLGAAIAVALLVWPLLAELLIG